mmetsp:Transcript_9727/g.13752  ORF Transcript_9727/g.13752 Transcript_9727/m.13752 type:complete len:143 (+) Transcript_9727:174-602(+)
MSNRQRNSEQHQIFTRHARQATILREKLQQWDATLRDPRGESWPTMLGRLNAALNQTGNLDRSIDDVMEHFVYVPKQSTANPQDIPFFLSTRLADGPIESNDDTSTNLRDIFQGEDPVQALARYENKAAEYATEYEENMIRY